MVIRNLDKACPKDEFPLPNIDLFIDLVAGNSVFSFMDGYNRYNQICMATKDEKKIINKLIKKKKKKTLSGPQWEIFTIQ